METNNEQLQELQNHVTNTLNLLKESLTYLVESFKSEIYDAFVSNKNDIGELAQYNRRIYEIDNFLKSCDNPNLCQLLTKCHVCLSKLLNIFNDLEKNDYYMKYSYDIKELILSLKNSLSL